jgi:hypothetical protein
MVVDRYQPNGSINGNSYGEWVYQWWKWALEMQPKDHPLKDSTGTHCHKGHKHPGVLFLGGTFDGDPTDVVRSYDLPTGKGELSILFPIINSNISREEHQAALGGKSDQEVIDAAKGVIDGVTRAEITIKEPDGTAKTYNKSDLDRLPHDRKTLYSFDLPADNVLNLGKKQIQSGLDGYWMFLKPLKKPGTYTIVFEAESPLFGGVPPNALFRTKSTYNLTVP